MVDRNLSQIESVFHVALGLPAGERAAYLSQACAGNESLYAEVCSLISAVDGRDSFMDQSGLKLGFEVISQSDEEAMIGQVIGAYKVLSRLGKGGMGEVYLAEDTRLERKVALKFLSPEFVGDNWAKRQLIKEAQAAAKLDHPNICSVYGIEEHGERSFIVMQYVEGETLANLVRIQPVSESQALSLTQQIVSALAEAHAHGIIHRDIKPKNIMVTPANHVKVLDFGLAKSIRQKKRAGVLDDSISHFSTNGHIVGTVSYMSPEQLRGEELDYRSDIFSVGSVIYEVVAGKSPFARKSEAETISAILSDAPPPVDRTTPKIPQALDRIARKCLEKQKEARYQSANELQLALQSLSEDGPAKRFPIGLKAVAAMALVVILIIAGLLAHFRQPTVRTLAVLPFSNNTGDASMDYLTHGIGISLIDRLSVASGLQVLTHTAVAGYKKRENDPDVVGRALGVDAVMVGTLVKDGAGPVLQTKLIRTSDGGVLWQTTSPVEISEILNLQRTISAKVVSSLDMSISAATERDREIGQTQNPVAFRLYWLGRSHFEHGRVDEAIAAFTEAKDLDPTFALAWTGLADSYARQPTVAYGSIETDVAMPKARAAAIRALQLAEGLPEAHISMGTVKLRYEWNWAEAEIQFTRAIELDPDRAAAHSSYANLLMITGRFEEAIEETKRAKDLDPFSPEAVMSLGRAYYRARRYDEAIDYLKQVLQENPNNLASEYVLGYAYLMKGMLKEAIDTFESVSLKRKWLAAAPLGYAYAKDGQREKALRILEEMEQQSQKTDPKEKKIPAQERAIVYIGLGDNDNAFAWLERAYAERFPPIISLTSEPIFDGLRSDPRFADLARRINLTP